MTQLTQEQKQADRKKWLAGIWLHDSVIGLDRCADTFINGFLAAFVDHIQAGNARELFTFEGINGKGYSRWLFVTLTAEQQAELIKRLDLQPVS